MGSHSRIFKNLILTLDSQRWALILEKLSLILDLDSQLFLENSHSHSQLSKNSLRTLILILNSQKNP